MTSAALAIVAPSTMRWSALQLRLQTRRLTTRSSSSKAGTSRTLPSPRIATSRSTTTGATYVPPPTLPMFDTVTVPPRRSRGCRRPALAAPWRRLSSAATESTLREPTSRITGTRRPAAVSIATPTLCWLRCTSAAGLFPSAAASASTRAFRIGYWWRAMETALMTNGSGGEDGGLPREHLVQPLPQIVEPGEVHLVGV
ncbi:hypothetical protein UCREL1_11521 [Eutypa lata UCREL1]|uniref:Uncharacterized protein n=1 Tax=Eutypa lata (strain UCR-EL1) TaxID=1287681 RepID=M7S651_EUTLA|nr:hypothetical protein UCREL1_11521 [Eutypa lata UCREL1]